MQEDRTMKKMEDRPAENIQEIEGLSRILEMGAHKLTAKKMVYGECPRAISVKSR